MSNQISRITIEVKELTNLKMKSLLGKTNITAKDISKVLDYLVDSTYSQNKGKRLMGIK